MRLLGVDLGAKRIGIAIGIPESGIATPRAALTSLGSLRKDAEQILRISVREETERIILGVPFSGEEEPSKRERISRQFADHLVGLGLKVEMIDESMTSIEAEQSIRDAVDITAAKRRRLLDGEAACRILERYFETHGVETK